MKKITSPPEIFDKVKSLISHTIHTEHLGNPNFELVHRAIIKKYFEAKNVSIDYAAEIVIMDIPVGKKKYTKITFECQDLERFLKSCLKKDDKSISFYKQIVSHYSTSAA